jgi:phosphoglycerol transferase
VLALNVSPSIVERIRHGTPPGVGQRTPTETELYGLRISQLYAPRRDHRIPALARLADDSTGAVVPSENGQQLGVIGALGLSAIVVLYMISALRRGAGEWWARRTVRLLVHLGFLAIVSMLIGAISSYSFLLSALGLREIRAWNRISIVIAFCALAAVALVADRLVDRVARRVHVPAPVMAAAVAVVLVAVGLFDQTSPADRPDYAAIHSQFASDEAFFRAVADRLPSGTPVFELPHVPFPEVPPVHGTAAYDQARGFVFQPQLAWSFGFVRGRHPEYPFAFEGRPASEWLTDLVAVGFQGLVIDRHGYPDDGAAVEAEVSAALGLPVLASNDGRYGFFDLTAFTGDARRRVGDAELAARAREVLARGPLGPRLEGPTPGR